MRTWNDTINEFVILLDKYLQRAKENTLPRRSRGELFQLAGAYAEAFNSEDMQKALGTEYCNEIFNIMLEMQKDIEDNNISRLEQEKSALEEKIKQGELMEERLSTIAGIFEGDALKMQIHDEKVKMCQELVDMDIKIYGEVSSETLQILEVQNVALIDGVVQEKEEKNVNEEASVSEKVDVMQELKELVQQHKAEMEQMKQGKKTLIVNAYAGPGAGKTTACLATVAELKKMGYVAEYVSEYAKELVYDNPQLLDGSMENQYTILKEQIHRLDRFMGQVDIIVTDSPILLNTIYGENLPEEYAPYVKQLYDQYDNFNFFVKRGEDFEQEGRVQNQEESIQKDDEIKNLLKDNKLFFGTYNHETVNNLASKIQITYRRIFEGIEGKKQPLPEKEGAGNENTKPKNTINGKEQAYKGTVYEKGRSNSQKGWSRPVDIYESSPEAILSRVQGWNNARSSDKQFEVCYVRKLNLENNTYENPIKYDVKTGIDITPIYLNLPHLSTDEYKKLVSRLSKDGARFNPIKKRYFVTKQANLNLFRDYLPIAGTQAEIGENRSRNELPYEIESGSDYYDNRVKITIEGMEPINIYGDAYDVHFPSLSAEETREIVEKYVLPGLEPPQSKPVQKQMEYNGRIYDRSQYNVIQKAISQHFTKEQLQMLERPELTSDRLNEVRFAIKDGLSAEQIMQFATPDHEQWQMDLCRIGMQHGFSYDDMNPVINPSGYNKEKWGERRNMLARMIKEKEAVQRPSALKKLRDNEKNVAARKASREKTVPEKMHNAPTVEK